MKKRILLLASLLVFLPNLAYLFQAWRSSRLDSWDWIFYLLSIPALIWSARETTLKKHDHWGWLLLLPAAILLFGRSWHQINAFGVLGSVALGWSMSWIFGGWEFAFRLLPAFLILTLGTPSLTYQMSHRMMIPITETLILKFALAAVGFLWIFCNKRYGWLLKKSSMFFIAASLFTALLLGSKELYFTGRSFIPEYSLQIGRFVGRSIQPDANTRHFFATSDVRQYRYAVEDIDISVLAVHCGKDIHEIHPASHCLRTSQWEIESEKLFFLYPDFAVTEIKARKRAVHILLWVWYSGKEFSTPSFLGFRRHFRPGEDCYTYQISIPIQEKESTRERKILQEFVITALQEQNANKE